MTETAFDRVSNALSATTGFSASAGRMWRCPAHDDNSPSLSVTPADDRVLIKCQAGCDTGAVLRALNLRDADLFDAPRANGKHDAPTDTYRYVDETGQLLFEVVRLPGKQFRQRRPGPGGEWLWKLGDVRRVLYRLPDVMAAVEAGKTIFVVEGEKDVHAIERAGGVATCNAGGAGKWRTEYADVLRGADVVIVVDQDPPGIKHAADVEASLQGRAKRVRVVQPLSGKDAADHLSGGHTLAEWTDTPNPRRLERSLLGGLLAGGVPEPAMVHPWLYVGGLHTIQSEPGVGKSFLALWLCLDLINDGWSVLYLDEEGGDELVTERLGLLGADPETVDRLFHYFPFPQRKWEQADLDALCEAIETAKESGPLALGVFDSLPDFLAAADQDENSSMEVTAFVHKILTPFRDHGAALLVLDHLTRQNEGDKKKRSRYSRGSGAKLAKAHLAILVEASEEFTKTKSGRLKLWRTKDRRGHTPLPRLSDMPLVLEVAVSPGSISIKEAESEGYIPQLPTRCMEAITTALTKRPGQKLSVSALTAALKVEGHNFGRGTVAVAAEALRADGIIAHEKGARGSDDYSISPPEHPGMEFDEEF